MASAKEILYDTRKREIRFDTLRDDIPEFVIVDGVLKRNWVSCPNCNTRVLVDDLPYFNLCPKCLTSWDELIASQGLEYKDYKTRIDWGKDWYKYTPDYEIENLINETIEDYLNLEIWVSSIIIKFIPEGSNIYNKYYVDISSEYKTCLIDLSRFIHKMFADETKTDEKRIFAINKAVTQNFAFIYDLVKERVRKKTLCNTIIFHLQGIEGEIKIGIENAYERVNKYKTLPLEQLIMQDDFLKGLSLTKEEMQKLKPHLNMFNE